MWGKALTKSLLLMKLGMYNVREGFDQVSVVNEAV